MMRIAYLRAGSYTFYWKSKVEGMQKELRVAFIVKSSFVERLELPIDVNDCLMTM